MLSHQGFAPVCGEKHLASICTKPPQMGLQPKCSSGGSQVKYYFNVALRACSQYTSNGCDTSLNSFASITECEEFCMGAGCKNGDTVYKVPPFCS